MTDEVRFDLFGIRTELDATRLQQSGSATAAAMSPPPPSTSPAADPLRRKDPWAATAPSGSADGTGLSRPGGLAGGAGVRQVRDEHLRFEVTMKVLEGSGRDWNPLEMTKDASGYASRRDRTLTVVACKYHPVRDLLLLAEREKNPIDDMTEVALEAKAGIPLLPAEVRLLSDTIFNNVKLLLHDNLLPRPRLSVCGPEFGGNSMT